MASKLLKRVQLARVRCQIKSRYAHCQLFVFSRSEIFIFDTGMLVVVRMTVGGTSPRGVPIELSQGAPAFQAAFVCCPR